MMRTDGRVNGGGIVCGYSARQRGCPLAGRALQEVAVNGQGWGWGRGSQLWQQGKWPLLAPCNEHDPPTCRACGPFLYAWLKVEVARNLRSRSSTGRRMKGGSPTGRSPFMSPAIYPRKHYLAPAGIRACAAPLHSYAPAMAAMRCSRVCICIPGSRLSV